jgi:hypothetical protein
MIAKKDEQIKVLEIDKISTNNKMEALQTEMKHALFVKKMEIDHLNEQVDVIKLLKSSEKKD